MDSNGLNPIADSRSGQIADWVELLILSGNRRYVSARKAADIIERTGGLGDDTDIALAFGVLHERASRELAAYPFSFSRLGLQLREGADSGPYALLVITSAYSAGHVSLARADAAALHLERLVATASRGLLGPRTSVVRFGFPPEPGRPTQFAEAVTWLAGKLRVAALPLRGSALSRADGGIDVVAWRPFSDEKAAAPVIVVQVTYEGDLRSKSLEIAANDVQRWMDIAPPVAALAVPFDSVDDPDLYSELASRVMLLDRWRILECLSLIEAESMTEYSAWARPILATMAI